MKPNNIFSLFCAQFDLNHLNRCFSLCFAFLLSIVSITTTQAGVTSSDQEGQRQLQLQDQRDEFRKQQQLRQQKDVQLERTQQPVIEDVIPEDETPCFVINEIILQGEESDRFQWLLSNIEKADEPPVLGRCLGAIGINAILLRMQNALIEKGYITTRVLAVPQDLNQGILVFELLPGKVLGIYFGPDTSPKAHYWNALPVRSGDILNVRDIEQGLENFQRLPTVETDIQIVPAQAEDAKPGESDLALSWKQRFPFRLNLSLDDSGSETIGRYQANATLAYDNWLTLNDLFFVSYGSDIGGGLSGQRGSENFGAHYSIPFRDWLLSFNTNSNDFEQSIAGLNGPIVFSGTSRNSEVTLSRLLFRNATQKLNASVGFWLRTSRNFVDDLEVLVQRRRTAGWQLGFDYRQFIGASTLNASANFRKGTGALSSLTAPEESFDEGTSRGEILRADVQLDIPFELYGQPIRYNTFFRGQANFTPLVPQDRLSIGGRFTVRGFDGELTLAAERGFFWRNEFSTPILNTGQAFYAGIDYGHVEGFPEDQLIGQDLLGGFFGVKGGYKHFSYDVFMGAPLNAPKGFITDSIVVNFSTNLTF